MNKFKTSDANSLSLLFSPFTLPCGVEIKNRLAKSAMSENLADRNHLPTIGLQHLYQRWAIGGIGLSITGNVMVDSFHLGEPHNVVIEKKTPLPFFLAWSKAGSLNQTSLWVQLNHPGKQSPKFINTQPVAPSSIPLASPMNRFFNTPKELSESEIKDIIDRFGKAAGLVKKAGFGGVQIHGAHGYLVSQFLSPHHNQRGDRWGGPLENRMRFVIEVYESIRQNVGNQFPVGIKINSADFQRGGFSEEESEEVICRLAQLGIDLIEISGGNYESPVMVGSKQRTREHEAYFIQFAQKVRQKSSVPLMVTGGIRSRSFMEQTLQDGSLDFIGLARPLAINPDFPRHLLEGHCEKIDVPPRKTGIQFIDRLAMLEITWYTQQLKRMANQQDPNPFQSNWSSIIHNFYDYGWDLFKKMRA